LAVDVERLEAGDGFGASEGLEAGDGDGDVFNA